MSVELEPTSARPPLGGLQTLKKMWLWLVIFGGALVALGALAIVASAIATLATILMYGILALIAGGVQVVAAFWARRWGGFFLALLAGLLYIVAGLLLIERPGLAAAGFTLMLAVVFLVGGLARIVVSLVERFEHWGWVCLNGVIALMLGLLIWQGFPESSLWVIGTFVGIDLVFNGVSWIMVGLAARKIPVPD